MSITIVTSLFDLSKREPHLGRKSAATILETPKTLAVNAPMVIFTESEFEQRILELRAGRPTTIILMQLEDAPHFAEYYPRLAENYKTKPIVDGNPTKDTPYYSYVMWLKYILMQIVIDKAMHSPETTHLCWMDIGMSYVSDYTYIDEFLAMRPEKFRLVLLNHPVRNNGSTDDIHYRYLRWICAGGLSLAPVAAMAQHCSRFNAEFTRAVFEGGFAPLDEQVTGRLLNMFPGDYEYSYGDYRSLITNFAGVLRDNLERAYAIYDQARTVGDTKMMADLLLRIQ